MNAVNQDNPQPEIPSALPARERIRARLTYLYGESDVQEIEDRILRLLMSHERLRTRTRQGELWTQEDVVLITYGDSIQTTAQAPLQTLHAFLNEHLKDALNMVHVLPFFPWSSDDGFAVTDFRAVKAELGTWQDIEDLSADFDLAIDLVLNHCSREHLWVVDFISGEEPACNYFIELDPSTNVSMVTRPRSTPVLSGIRTQRGLRYLWTTFSNDQVDLNYANPDVLIEFIELLLSYVRHGARLLRLDAVAYLWKQLGTACIHLPQTHQVVKLFRDILEIVEPAVLIMTETNVPHQENMRYFGEGDEAHVIYQFSLPPLLLHALHAGSSRYLNAWAIGLESFEQPSGCTCLNFTASHDGVGLRPLEGLVPEDGIREMLDTMRERGGYISTKSNSDGSESPYELNISYFDAFREPEGDNRWHVPKFMVSQIISLSFRGIPAVYIHCLTATPNDTIGVERTGMTRSVNRRKWDLGELQYQIGNLESDTGRVFTLYVRLLELRRRQVAFHPDATQRILSPDERVFCFERTSLNGRQRILVLANLSGDEVELDLEQLPTQLSRREELLGLNSPVFEHGLLRVEPYAVFWFSE